jgi:hypothetical protein
MESSDEESDSEGEEGTNEDEQSSLVDKKKDHSENLNPNFIGKLNISSYIRLHSLTTAAETNTTQTESTESPGPLILERNDLNRQQKFFNEKEEQLHMKGIRSFSDSTMNKC